MHWWERDGLHYDEAGRLCFAGRDVGAWLSADETPAFLYSADQVHHNLQSLHNALGDVPHKIYFAIKSNRFRPILTYLRLTGLCGIDTCSPNEIALARQMGWRDDEISFVGNSLSNRDLDYLVKHPDVLVTCDSLSTIRRLGERCAGREIGLRVNPSLGAGYNESLQYAGEKPTKFGIYADRFEEALALAASYRMRVRMLHFHSGSGYLDCENFGRILTRVSKFLDLCSDVEILDIGGGLGVPLSADDTPLDLTEWATHIAAIAKTHNVTIHIEPGDYIVKNAGILVAEINMIEDKQGVIFVGTNAGLNMQGLTPYYDIPCEVVPLQRRNGKLQAVTIVGNINESIDVLAENIALPSLEEGDLIAFLNVGGYAVTMSSNHCLRGDHREMFLPLASQARPNFFG